MREPGRRRGNAEIQTPPKDKLKFREEAARARRDGQSSKPAGVNRASAEAHTATIPTFDHVPEKRDHS